MGRITNMIRSSLRNRMNDSLLDALIRTYKNSGHLQFWEDHLDNLMHCHLNIMGANQTNPIWQMKTDNSYAKVYNFDPNPPKIRTLTKSKNENSIHRERNQNSHRRQLTIQKIFNTEYDVVKLIIKDPTKRTKNIKKRK